MCSGKDDAQIGNYQGLPGKGAAFECHVRRIGGEVEVAEFAPLEARLQSVPGRAPQPEVIGDESMTVLQPVSRCAQKELIEAAPVCLVPGGHNRYRLR